LLDHPHLPGNIPSVNPELPDAALRRQQAVNLHAEAVNAMSITRDQTIEITSARQLRIWEDTARQILALRTNDTEINAKANAMLEDVAAARRWIWVNQTAATLLGILAVSVGVGAAIFGGLTANITLATIGALAGSALLGAVILRYRREHWRIRAEQLALMIWKPGV
jgi:hypothetical protein